MKFLTLYIATFFFAAFAAHAAEKSGPLSGSIVGRDVTKNELTIAHGDVPGVMGAMTMNYVVRGQKVSALPKDGAKVTATLHESNGDFWLTNVKAAEMPAKEQHHEMSGMEHMPGMKMSMPMEHDAVSDLLMRQASGTSMNPQTAPMHMSMTQHGDWMLMLHGQAFISDVQQTGPRGGDKFFSTNWGMGMADRKVGDGHLMLRSMLSLEPATVGDEYPELFQTGETLHGQPIVDAQHPHDLFMELAAEYARPLAGNTIGYLYAAPVGDPALGPVAFPHRASASEIPQATLGHHLQDSTHIAGSVITLGAQSGALGYAFSGFHGREPDENRWDIDTGRIDSWSTRITFDPTPNWTAQVSTGHLHHPEALEPRDVQRTTASVAYSNAFSSTSLIYGHSEKNSFLAESVLHFGMNYVTGRGEIVDKAFRVKALTLGYTRDVFPGAGVGTNVTLYSIPDSAKAEYGSSPKSVYLFVRIHVVPPRSRK